MGRVPEMTTFFGCCASSPEKAENAIHETSHHYSPAMTVSHNFRSARLEICACSCDYKRKADGRGRMRMDPRMAEMALTAAAKSNLVEEEVMCCTYGRTISAIASQNHVRLANHMPRWSRRLSLRYIRITRCNHWFAPKKSS